MVGDMVVIVNYDEKKDDETSFEGTGGYAGYSWKVGRTG